MEGMAVEEVKRLATELRDAAEEIERIKNELTQGLEGVYWEGQDADTFRSSWEGEMVPALDKLKSDVAELGETAERNAAEQARVSGS